jgi:hypothetical protein
VNVIYSLLLDTTAYYYYYLNDFSIQLSDLICLVEVMLNPNRSENEIDDGENNEDDGEEENIEAERKLDLLSYYMTAEFTIHMRVKLTKKEEKKYFVTLNTTSISLFLGNSVTIILSTIYHYVSHHHHHHHAHNYHAHHYHHHHLKSSLMASRAVAIIFYKLASRK